MPHDDALPVLFTTDAPVVAAVERALSARGAADDGHGPHRDHGRVRGLPVG